MFVNGFETQVEYHFFRLHLLIKKCCSNKISYNKKETIGAPRSHRFHTMSRVWAREFLTVRLVAFKRSSFQNHYGLDNFFFSLRILLIYSLVYHGFVSEILDMRYRDSAT